MQLILNSETDITIQRKMAAIEQEAFDEKFVNVLTNDLDKEITTIKKDYIEKNTNDNTIINDDDKLLEEKLNENDINSTDQNEPNNDAVTLSNECDEPVKGIPELVENNDSETVENISDHEEMHNMNRNVTLSNECNELVKEIPKLVENNDSETIENISDHEEEHNIECEVTDLQSKEATEYVGAEVVKQYIDNEIVDNIQEIVINNEKQETEIKDNTIEKKETFEKIAEHNEEDTITESVRSDEVMDIVDDIKEDCIEDKNILNIEENTVSMHTLGINQDTEIQDNAIEIKEIYEKKAESTEENTITECVESDEVMDIDDEIEEDCIEDKNKEIQDNTLEIKEIYEKKAGPTEENTITDCVESDEVMDIVDDIKEDCVEDKNIFNIEENTVSMTSLHVKQETGKQVNTIEIKYTFENKAEPNKEDTITECVESDEVIDIADEIKENCVEIKNIFNNEKSTVSMTSLQIKQETGKQANSIEIKETFENKAESNKEDTITACVEIDEVIDIADEIKEVCIEDKSFFDIEENTVSINSLDKQQEAEIQDNTIKIKKNFENIAEPNKEDTIIKCVESDEVIDIADDIKEDCIDDKNIFDIEENTVSVQSLDVKGALNTQSLDKENTTSAMQSINNLTSGKNIVVDNEKEQNEKIKSLTEKNILVNKLAPQKDQETLHKQETTNCESSNDVNKDSNKVPVVCKLSNTLDILSDDEEEVLLKAESSKVVPSIEETSRKEPSREKKFRKQPSDDEPSNKEPAKEEFQKEELNRVEKSCINTEDDDVIMLVDEDQNPKDDKNCKMNENDVEKHKDEFVCQEIQQINGAQEEPAVEKEIMLESSKDEAKTELPILSKKSTEAEIVEKQSVKKPLLPVNFLKTCKKNLAEMTREEIEEFCILKIVESVVDRSNLNEIKSQLNTMSQNIEEHKKKGLLLLKQNRDLQVVLKSVQEEQKKRSDLPITPLKITRSVGMQVFMTDKMVAQKKSLAGPNNLQNNLLGNSTPNRQNKIQTNQTTKTQKAQINTNNSNQIPVPRLVPAVNNSMNLKQPSATNSSAKTTVTPTTPNGIRNSPSVKAEKRPHSKMQQGNSVTVDLTDDEPPAKILQRNMTPPVRLVPPQNLLAPQRQPFGSTISSPRKVYIPISGSQNQVRPGQNIMPKPVIPSGPRQRVPNILNKPNLNMGRMPRLAPRHPPPLPDCIKQYQPPNWKSLPPAPDLKLSKVDNGIVISWKIEDYNEDNHEEIASYQLYAYQEIGSPANPSLWKKIGDVKALPLPMACTLTQFMSGFKYHFAVRAVDIRSRLGPFSAPGNILLIK